jgi:hypothetical protein
VGIEWPRQRWSIGWTWILNLHANSQRVNNDFKRDKWNTTWQFFSFVIVLNLENHCRRNHRNCKCQNRWTLNKSILISSILTVHHSRSVERRLCVWVCVCVCVCVHKHLLLMSICIKIDQEKQFRNCQNIFFFRSSFAHLFVDNDWSWFHSLLDLFRSLYWSCDSCL